MLTSTKLRRWIQSREVPSGELVGDPMRVWPWQGKVLKRFDGPVDLAVSVARGNGESGLAGAIAAAHLDPALGLTPPGSDIVIVAASLRQARIVFGDAITYLRQVHDLSKRKVWRLSDSLQYSELTRVETRTRLVAVGTNPKTAHGLRPKLVILDEPAQWEAGKRDAMISALWTARGKVKGSRLFWIGTRPDEPAHPFAAELEGPGGFSYAAEADADPWRAPSWHAANPSLRFLPELRRVIAEEALLAKRDGGMEASFRALRLNRGVSDTASPRLVGAGLWREAERRKALPVGRPVIGVDLASTEMAAAAAIWQSARAEAVGYFPRIPDLKERGRRDHAGDLYLKMHGRGELTFSGEQVIDVASVLEDAVSRWGAPVAFVVDRWRRGEVVEAIAGRRIPIVTRGQGFKDGGEDIRRFRRVAADGWLAPPVSLLLRSSLAASRTAVDPAGNVKLARHGRKKDDAASALVMAAGEASRRRPLASARPRRMVAV
ncbi:terminase TerL endonuclease subunit [Candidatus Palauibacter sp.]|uniref:terminase TerL endonuclease subunit n=1 Tax=Candidatus Palauibacter sp. TaxID=3101350 RepID=UPI003B022B73